MDLSGPADEDAGDRARDHPARGRADVRAVPPDAARARSYERREPSVLLDPTTRSSTRRKAVVKRTLLSILQILPPTALRTRASTRTLGYAPALDAADFKQSVGAFTTSAWRASGTGRWVPGGASRARRTATWSCGTRPSGQGLLPERTKKPTKNPPTRPMRGTGSVGGRRALGGRRRALDSPARDQDRSRERRVGGDARVGDGRVGGGRGARARVRGGADGHVRFYDQKLRLVAWFDGLDAGAVAAVSSRRRGGSPFGRPARRRARGSPRATTTTRAATGSFRGAPGGYASEDEEMFMGDFDARISSSRRRAARCFRPARRRSRRRALGGGLGRSASVARPRGRGGGARRHPRAPEVCVVGSTGAVWTWITSGGSSSPRGETRN